MKAQKRWYFLHVSLIIGAVSLWLFTTQSKSFAADLRILFVGNSYTYGNNLDQLVKQALEDTIPFYKDVFAASYALGGYRWEQHSKDAAGTNGTNQLHNYLVLGKDPNFQWDFVIFQEQSQIPGFPETDQYRQASLAGLRSLHALAEKKGAKTVLMMTWGRRKGDSRNANIFPNYKAMQARLTAGYKSYAAKLSTPQNPVYIAPVGLAWEKVYDDLVAAKKDPVQDGSAFSALYTPDDSHPSLRGSYLAACVLLATLTGYDPTRLTWIPNTSLPAPEVTYLREVAKVTVFSRVFGELSFPWAFEWKAYPWPTDLVVGGKSISALGSMPLVRLKTKETAIPSLRLGSEHKGKGHGAGRLRIDGGGELEVTGDLVIGDTGIGELVELGGRVQAKTIILGKEATGEGHYILKGGILQSTSIVKGQGKGRFSMDGGLLTIQKLAVSLEQKGGLLSPGPKLVTLSLGQDYTLGEKGTLEIEVTDASQPKGKGYDTLKAAGKVLVSGTIAIKGATVAAGVKLTVIEASEITLQDGWKIRADFPIGHEIITTSGGEKALLIFRKPSGQEPSPQEPAPEVTPKEENVTSPKEMKQEPATSKENPIVPKEKDTQDGGSSPKDTTPSDGATPSTGGCCSATHYDGSWLWLMVLLWMGVVLKRR